MTELSFVAILLAFVAIGLSSALRARRSRTDYYLAGRAVAPWLCGLSAVATNNSGYMFIGVIGFTYATGFSAIWLMVGWILGDLVGSTVIHRKLRKGTERTDEASFAAVIARWYGEDFRLWRRIAALVMIVFLGAYAAAQISAGGKALQGVLGWQPAVGALVVAAMILAYSVAGGIRASIWTDAAQSSVMLIAMALLFLVAIDGQGGFQSSAEKLAAVPGYLDLFPATLLIPGAAGMGLFVLGWMFAGFSVVGQPHVMVRFMALNDAANMTRARVWYYSFFTAFYALATGVGLLSRLYLPELGGMDPELALPSMAVELLPPVLVGVILAGIFAATMSTADSLVLSCSAAITHDLLPRRLETTWEAKVATAVVTLLALGIAMSETRSVFQLVILSWAALASAFAPLLTIYAMRRRISETGAIAAMVTGVAIAILWRAAELHEMVYEGLPGIAAGFVVALILSRTAEPQQVEFSKA